MSSCVRFAAWMPAMRATVRTAPFGRSSATMRSRVERAMRTIACAFARRRVTSFSPTSTMRASPSSSTWLSFARSSAAPVTASPLPLEDVGGGDAETLEHLLVDGARSARGRERGRGEDEPLARAIDHLLRAHEAVPDHAVLADERANPLLVLGRKRRDEDALEPKALVGGQTLAKENQGQRHLPLVEIGAEALSDDLLVPGEVEAIVDHLERGPDVESEAVKRARDRLVDLSETAAELASDRVEDRRLLADDLE